VKEITQGCSRESGGNKRLGRKNVAAFVGDPQGSSKGRSLRESARPHDALRHPFRETAGMAVCCGIVSQSNN
jgi:hypothetical protein